MVKLDIAVLRPVLDLENNFVDFNVLRSSLTVAQILQDLKVNLSEPSKEGERRGKCPKCQKEKSFSFNINNNRFNCFTKGCALKGGGVIDFFARLHEIPAKEASHLLAYAYGIQPYTQMPVEKSQPRKSVPVAEIKQPERKQPSREVVSRTEFDELQKRVERLATIVWSLMFEKGEIDDPAELFDEQKDFELEQIVST
jgi:hypothetical protein